MSRISLPITDLGTASDGLNVVSVTDQGVDLVTVSEYGSEAKARTKLRGAVLTALKKLWLQEKNRERRAIGCHDGTVIIVEWDRECWVHHIVGPERNNDSMTITNDSTFEQALTAARSHANGSYGGVAWETKIL